MLLLLLLLLKNDINPVDAKLLDFFIANPWAFVVTVLAVVGFHAFIVYLFFKD